MGKYRKKPVVIDAMQFIPVDLNGDINKHLNYAVQFDDWMVSNQGETKCRYVGDTVVIPTLEGDMVASAFDWIIRGVKGELYPCKPDIFEATYDPVAPNKTAPAD